MSDIDLSNPSSPKHIVWEPYRRARGQHLITILAGPFDTKGEAETFLRGDTSASSRPNASTGILRPLDGDLPAYGDSSAAHRRFLAASWSRKSPKRLKIGSVPMTTLGEADDWAGFLVGSEGEPGRTFLTLELPTGQERL